MDVAEGKMSNRPWHKTWWGLLFILLFWPYFLAWYTWTRSRWNKVVRVAITAVCGIAAFASLGIAAAATQPQPSNVTQHNKSVAAKKSQDQPSSSTSNTASAGPPSATPNRTVDAAQVKAYLNDGTSYYIQLFQRAQQALGTAQYPDAYSGLNALNDPTSAASRWSVFHQNFIGSDYSSEINQAYNNASNLYTDAGLDTPSAVGDWNDDMNQAFTDLSFWVSDATSWQISSISNAQFNGDTQKVQQDIAKAQADIAKL